VTARPAAARQASAALRLATRVGRRPRASAARVAWRGAAATFLLAWACAGCRAQTAHPEVNPAPARPLTQVLAAHTPELMKLPGVVGTAESRTTDGRPCILVLVERMTPDLERSLPRSLEGWPVRIDAGGPIRAMPDSSKR
jgi:hypothetical protein